MSNDATIGSVLGSALVVWMAGLGVLTLVGLVLSRMALRTAAAAPERQSGHARGMTAALRAVYRTVLWLCCMYYYVSLPLVLVVVVGVGGGIIYLCFLVG